MPTLPGQSRLIRAATAAANNEQVGTESNTLSPGILQRTTTALSQGVTGISTPISNLKTISQRSFAPLTDRDISPAARSECGSRAARKNRRNRVQQDPEKNGLGDKMDKSVLAASENMQDWLLRSCMDKPLCQQVFSPADHATRHAKRNEEDKPGDIASGNREQGQQNTHYGYPDFTAAGFTVVPVEEAMWVDMMVPERLGLMLATHRKTSVQRLCYMINKANLATHTTLQEVTHLVRALKRCDHVNILQVNEVFEDSEMIYLMYEAFPCCTLLSQLEKHTWNEAQIVNIARECCAATAYCSEAGLRHIGWTLCHVLLPAKAAEGGDPAFCKVFGFGLMGTLVLDTYDHLLWGPEALDKFKQQNGNLGNFLLRLEGPVLIACDSWSLGAVIYSLIARRPPAATEENIQAKRWSFTLAIDDMGPEARTLVESFLHSNPERRLRPERALHHEWVRRNWRCKAGGGQVFIRLEQFVQMPLAKRIFAKFLTFFLDADHFLKIAENFCRLDMVGNGVIMLRELELAAKRAGQKEDAAKAVHQWFGRDGEHISLIAFAECYAEEVIDGKALRHAFESLDDDGSQQISADELFHALKQKDSSVTMEDVLKHINAAELDVMEDEQVNNVLDYSEFVKLFPECKRRTAAVNQRIDDSHESALALAEKFRQYQEEVEKWFTGMDAIISDIGRLIVQTLQRGEQAGDAVRELVKTFAHADHALKCPPGPENDAVKAQQRSGKKAVKSTHVEFYGFDTYLIDIGMLEQWSQIIQAERQMLKSAKNKDKFIGQVEQIKAHDAGDTVKKKLEDIVHETRGQYEEYLSFVEGFESPEPQLGPVSFSGRALPPRAGDADEDEILMAGGDSEEEEGSGFAHLIKSLKVKLGLSE